MRIETFLGQVLRRGVTELLRSGLRGLFAACSEPNSAETFARRGMARYTGRDDDGAIADCTESIRICPNHMAYWARGGAYIEKGKFKEAIADLTEAIRLKPTIAEVYYLRSVAYVKRGDRDNDEANVIADMVIADRLGPQDPQVREHVKGVLQCFVSAWRKGECLPPGLSEETKAYLEAAAREVG